MNSPAVDIVSYVEAIWQRFFPKLNGVAVRARSEAYASDISFEFSNLLNVQELRLENLSYFLKLFSCCQPFIIKTQGGIWLVHHVWLCHSVSNNHVIGQVSLIFGNYALR